MIQSEGHKATHYGNFAGVLASSDPQLVDCGLCDLCSLLSFIQLMLNLPEPDCATAHVLLLADTRKNSSHNSNSLSCEGTFANYTYTLSSHEYMIVINTHCILSLSFIAFDFGLKFIDQVLHPEQSLVVFLSLQREVERLSNTTSAHPRRKHQVCANLVGQLSASPLVSADTFLVVLAPLLLHHQLCLELPHLTRV